MMSPLYQCEMHDEIKRLIKIFSCSAKLSCSSASVSVQNIHWRQLLKGRGNVFIVAIDDEVTGLFWPSPEQDRNKGQHL